MKSSKILAREERKFWFSLSGMHLITGRMKIKVRSQSKLSFTEMVLEVPLSKRNVLNSKVQEVSLWKLSKDMLQITIQRYFMFSSTKESQQDFLKSLVMEWSIQVQELLLIKQLSKKMEIKSLISTWLPMKIQHLQQQFQFTTKLPSTPQIWPNKRYKKWSITSAITIMDLEGQSKFQPQLSTLTKLLITLMIILISLPNLKIKRLMKIFSTIFTFCDLIEIYKI